MIGEDYCQNIRDEYFFGNAVKIVGASLVALLVANVYLCLLNKLTFLL